MYINNKWTPERISILKEKYPACGVKIPELLNVGLDKDEIQNGAYHLKLKRQIHPTDHEWHPNKRGLKIRYLCYTQSIGGTIYFYEFEDGVKIPARSSPTGHYTIQHPTLKSWRYDWKGTFAGFDTRYILTDKNTNDAFYVCECQKCRLKQIMTPQEMIEHQKECLKTQ